MNPTTTEETHLLSLDELAARFAAAARTVFADAEPVVTFEPPRRAEFGDLATNVAFALAKTAKQPPPKIADAIVAAAMRDAAVAATVVEATQAGGFINLRLVPAYWHGIVARILREGADYGRGPAQAEKISLEFGSANPTGPLVVVQGRTLSVGDTLANVLRHAGYDVFTEWIINDAGAQIDALGRSIYARYRQFFDPAFPFPEDGYHGAYITPLAQALRDRYGEKLAAADPAQAVPMVGKYGRDVLVAEQQDVARRFRVGYDLWQSEKELHDAGAVETGIARLRELGKLYEKDGATWMRTTESGDDEDRVVIRTDGRPTYYSNDIAYHYAKLQRADRVIDILGPDHHGYIARLNALADAYGRSGAIEVLIAQLITLKRGDEVLSMSKRAGNVVTLAEVIDEVGVDAARFFFTMLSLEQPLTFDLDLAKKQSNDNPVYYVQYGHARIASVLRRAAADAPDALATAEGGAQLARLTEPAELALIRRLAEFPATIAGAARARAPHRIPKFARDVATDFHQFYDACRIVNPADAELSAARIALAMAAKSVLATTLALCGVSAPETM